MTDCLHCGKPIESRNGRRKFCSDAHRVLYWQKNRQLPVDVVKARTRRVPHPHQVTKDFEAGLSQYTGAPHVVVVNSCSMALLLACAWWARTPLMDSNVPVDSLSIPKRTYVSVPMSIRHAGWGVRFRDEQWRGEYQLKPIPVWDCARRFTKGMYRRNTMQCVSFHWSKILGIQQGGAILHDNPDADEWFRRARLDGRREGVPPKDDHFDFLGWHCYISPEVAAQGLMRLSLLKDKNEDLPNDEYPDLSQFEVFTNA